MTHNVYVIRHQVVGKYNAHTRTYTRAHAQAAHTHSNTQIIPGDAIHKNIHMNSHTHAHTYIHAHTHTHTRTITHTHTQTHTPTQTHTHTHTHTTGRS